MKLLLTSAGIRNKTIADAILDLVGVPANEVKLVFVPTAANLEKSGKGWLIDDLRHFQEQDYGFIDIVDISAIPEDKWRPRLEKANLICFGGGDEQYLAKMISESGLGATLPELLETRVFMGISAGSMVAGKFMPGEVFKQVYPKEQREKELEPSLDFVDLIVIPHLNSAHFPQSRKEILESIEDLQTPLYGIDDNSAIKVADGEIEIVGEGESVVV